jgi:hypothetical protein
MQGISLLRFAKNCIIHIAFVIPGANIQSGMVLFGLSNPEKGLYGPMH